MMNYLIFVIFIIIKKIIIINIHFFLNHMLNETTLCHANDSINKNITINMIFIRFINHIIDN